MSDLQFFHQICDIIRPDLATGPWIAGGYPMRIYAGMSLVGHDIDIFFRDQDQLHATESAFREHYQIKIPEVTPTTDEDDGWLPTRITTDNILATDPGTNSPINVTLYESSNARTYTNDVTGDKVQFIFSRFPSDIEDLLNGFDISCIKIATDGKEFVASPRTYQHIEDSVLHFDDLRANSIKRFNKYVAYGFHPTKETIRSIYQERNTLLWDYQHDTDY